MIISGHFSPANIAVDINFISEMPFFCTETEHLQAMCIFNLQPIVAFDFSIYTLFSTYCHRILTGTLILRALCSPILIIEVMLYRYRVLLFSRWKQRGMYATCMWTVQLLLSLSKVDSLFLYVPEFYVESLVRKILTCKHKWI